MSVACDRRYRHRPVSFQSNPPRESYGFGDAPTGGDTFLDLGAGEGNATAAAAFLHPWRHCQGFEIVERLHASSTMLADEFNEGSWRTDSVGDAVAASSAIGVNFSTSIAQSIGFELADARSRGAEWCQQHRPSFVYAHATCFDDRLMAEIAAALVR